MIPLRSSLIAVLILHLASPALAGGAFVNTVQAGSWLDGSTWDTGLPPDAGGGEQANIDHDVVVDGPGAEANVTNIGSISPARVTVTSGTLDPGQAQIGAGATGELFVEGGSVTGQLQVAPSGSEGTLSISGGSLTLSSLQVAGFGGAPLGFLVVEGGAASIDAQTTAFTNTFLGVGARVTVRPTANGSAGLSTVLAPNLQIQAGAALELDTSLYAAQVGDEWDVFTYSGSLLGAGSFTTLTATSGWTVEQDVSTPGVVTLRVTGAPGPPAVPTMDDSGHIALVALLVCLAACARRTGAGRVRVRSGA